MMATRAIGASTTGSTQRPSDLSRNMRLVLISMIPKDPAYNNPPGKDPGKPGSHRKMGQGILDIRYDVELDDSLFRTEPPEGYAVEIKQRDRITEKEN